MQHQIVLPLIWQCGKLVSYLKRPEFWREKTDAMCARVTVWRPAGQWSYVRARGVSFGCVVLDQRLWSRTHRYMLEIERFVASIQKILLEGTKKWIMLCCKYFFFKGIRIGTHTKVHAVPYLRLHYLHQVSWARLYEPDGLVLAGCGKEASVSVERHGEDNICVVADCPHGVLYDRLRTVQIPDHHLQMSSDS